VRTLPPSAAAAAAVASSSLRSTDDRQIQNNKRQTAGGQLCLLTYAVSFEARFISCDHWEESLKYIFYYGVRKVQHLK